MQISIGSVSNSNSEQLFFFAKASLIFWEQNYHTCFLLGAQHFQHIRWRTVRIYQHVVHFKSNFYFNSIMSVEGLV